MLKPADPQFNPREEDILVRAVGDLLLDDSLPPHRDADMAPLVDLLRNADVAFGNLEAPLVDDGIPISKIDVARSFPPASSRLRDLGFRAVSIANNHIMDYGAAGLETTQNALAEAGIAYAGAGTHARLAFAPTLFHSGRRKVALIAFHAYFSASWLHYADPIRADEHQAGAALIQGYQVRVATEPPIISNAPEERHLSLLCDSIAGARKEADLVLVSMHTHWDVDDVDHVTAPRSLIARAAIDAGADLVMGHGPHVVNGIESYKGRFVLHSLGNFFFSIPPGIEHLYPAARRFVSTMTQEDRFWLGMMAGGIFRSDGPCEALRLRAVVIEREGPKRGLPRLGDEDAARRLLEALTPQSEPLGVGLEMADDATLLARALR